MTIQIDTRTKKNWKFVLIGGGYLAEAPSHLVKLKFTVATDIGRQISIFNLTVDVWLWYGY